MAKLKDGFYKLTAQSIGSDLSVLLAGGGAKPISDFASAFNVKLWGQSFDGTGNVSGALSNVHGIVMNNTSGNKYGFIDFHYNGSSSLTSNIFEAGSGQLRINDVLVVNKNSNVGIGTTGPSFKLQVAGDVYCSGWSRSPSGLYIDTGVYYTANSSYPEIVSNGNEIVFASTTSDMYVNYRTSGIRGNTVSTWIWCAGSGTSYASHVMGNLTTIGSIYINTGDPTLKIYSGEITDARSDGNICLQTSIDATDGQSHAYPTLYGSRCNLVLQPRGGLVYIGTNPDGGNTSYKLYIAGNTYASGSLYAAHFYENSDINLKTNIETITNSDNIPQLKSFDWKSDGKHSYGLIALELEEQGYNELVEDNGDHKTVNYSAALSLIVGKLQVKIKELEREIEILKNKN